MKSELKAKVIALIITTLLTATCMVKNNVFSVDQKQVETNQLLAMNSYVEYDISSDLDGFISENIDTFNFYCDMFGINLETLKEEIINSNDGKVLDKADLGNKNVTYDSLDKNLIDYLYNLREENPKLFNQKYSNASDYSKDYVYGLIKYFSNIYNNVDYATLASIAYIESGNLNAKYMMASNNIYGGISKNHLIKYQNIEYGVLSYVKMMSERYYGKGLNTVEKIARVYNPNSDSWIYNVKSYTKLFNNEEIINIKQLINLK